MPSGWQLNSWGTNGGIQLLTINPNAATTVANPLAAYGTIGVNDSGAYVGGRNSTKWKFQLAGAGATTPGYTVAIYGTIDPAVYIAYTQQSAKEGLSVVPPSSWFLLDAPSAQAGTGSIANPMVSGMATYTEHSGILVAIRAVLIATTGTPTANIQVFAMAGP